jgi:hypothetical protein
MPIVPPLVVSLESSRNGALYNAAFALCGMKYTTGLNNQDELENFFRFLLWGSAFIQGLISSPPTPVN